MTEETLSDKILSWEGVPFLLSVEDVKDFIKKLKYFALIDLGKDTLTISYTKFKELTGKELVE